MDSSKVKIFLVAIFAAISSIYLGVASATAQVEAVAWVIGAMGLALVLALGKNVWVLIPLGLVLQGKINFLPGSPPTWALFSALTAVMFVLRFAMHRPDFIWRPNMIDFAVLIQLGVIGQAYVRNPTGLLIMGGDMGGGRSYLEFGAAIIAYFCLSIVRPEWKFFKLAICVIIGTSIIDSCIYLISDWIPAFSSYVIPIYSNVNFDTAYTGNAERNLDTQRGGAGLAQLGRALALPCLMMVRPLLCINPLNPFLLGSVLLGVISSMLSGFRSFTIYLLVIFVVSAMVRKKYLEIILVCLISFVGLSVLIASDSIRHLPFGMQRVFSVLPIEVDSEARYDAENSSEWRFEMWELALFTDRYIENKLFGDGFGLKASELRAIADAALGYQSSLTDSQEQALARGSYHGFHVETIRFTGFLGLALAVFANCVFFVSALKSINFYREHVDFGYVAYIAIPFLVYPLWSLLVFGSYRVEFPQILAMAGMIKMLENLRFNEEKSVVSSIPENQLNYKLPAQGFSGAANSSH